ncbi:MAG TPA: glycoside hydrolase family 31 protein [Bryobacteraceae bacterium]|nr:glycoside hydrolase family 31 protein [Bryobacteraceae bacterium]HPU74009.1 glycoside hydrolase family 31 protein [Bryobacteraceae bacterium]
MSRSIFAVALLAVCLPGQTRRTNTFELSPAEGWAEVEWVSTSTFRYSRAWGAAPGKSRRVSAERVDVTVEDLGERIRFKTGYLTVEVDKSGNRIDVTSSGGRRTWAVFTRADGVVRMESGVSATERFYGLGPHTGANLDRRGSVVETRRPFLVSTRGYGEYFRTPGTYRFDLGSTDKEIRRVTVPGDRIEYFYYHGPTPKQIMEEHYEATGEYEDFGTKELAVRKAAAAPAAASWEDLRKTVYRLQHESMSGMQVPEFNLAPYQAAGGGVYERAAQLAAFIPLAGATSDTRAPYRSMQTWRTRLVPYMLAYGYEVATRGIPVIHPLVMQFPKDAEAWKYTDEFMVGDELLVAPVLGNVDSVQVYFPQGIWTDLRTNKTYNGRQVATVPVVPGEMPIFVRNGSILPLAAAEAGGPMELHYFPKLAAEFFLYEEDLRDISQVHAAPAGEFMRLETESLKARTYEWVVHHSPPCRKVEMGTKLFVQVSSRDRLAPGRWFYDKASGNLHVRVRAAAGGDEIVNISF